MADELSLTANLPTGQRGYSQSPSRDDDMYGNAWDRRDHHSRPHRQPPSAAAPDYRDAHDARPRRSLSPRDWSHDNQGRMYNDDYHRGRHDQDRGYDYGSSSSYRDRRSYNSRSPHGDYYSRSRSRSPAREGGRLREAGLPSDTVIFEGLPVRVDAMELRESIIRDCISDNYSLVDVRITYSKGKRRAFIQFEEVDHAAAFVNENFPKVLITLPHTTDEVPDGRISAYIHFAHRREDAETRASGAGGGQWICQPCGFNNYSSRTKCKRCGSSPSSSTMRLSLNPAADAADAPTQILVVYPLTAFVNEDMFATDMKRLELEKLDTASQKLVPGSKLQSTAPADRAARTGARPGSLHRVFLMRDPNTEESVKYGFAEFWTLQDAVDAMAKIKLLPSFTVAACAVNVSHIHMGVFIPEEREVTPDTERYSFTPLFNTTLRVRYRDLRAYPSQKLISTEPPEAINADGELKGGDPSGNNKKPKKRKADDPQGAAAAKRAVPAMAGHMAMWQKKHEEIHTGESDEKSAAKQPPPALKSSKEAPIKFSFTGASMQASGPSAVSSVPVHLAPPAPSSAPPPPPEEQNNDDIPAAKPDVQAQDEKPITYADRDKLQCLLCMRKFKSLDELSRHGKSKLHAEKLLDEQSVKSAVERLSKRGIQLPKQAEAGDDTGATAPQYRDRAKERREQWNQPKKPPPAPADKSAAGPQKDQGKAPVQEKAPAQSKGAGMLAKMGWMSGSGLGANAEGRTESIVTHVYRQGVGLGAEGANLGDAQAMGESRTLNKRKDYVDAVNDRARERFFNEFGEKKDDEQNSEDKKEE